MSRALSNLALVTLLAIMLAGCQSGPSSRDAQEVKVVIVGDEVRLDPSTVQAGKVRLTVQPSEDAARFAFITLLYSLGEGGCGPLSEEALAELAQGSRRGASCGTGIGPEGIVDTLHPGKYAVAIQRENGPVEDAQAELVSVAILVVEATPAVSPSPGT
jgi:hypothetical protein